MVMFWLLPEVALLVMAARFPRLVKVFCETRRLSVPLAIFNPATVVEPAGWVPVSALLANSELSTLDRVTALPSSKALVRMRTPVLLIKFSERCVNGDGIGVAPANRLFWISAFDRPGKVPSEKMPLPKLVPPVLLLSLTRFLSTTVWVVPLLLR